MSRKNVILPTKWLDAASLGASIASASRNVTYLDRASIEISATTSDAVGTFSVEGSASGSVWVPLSMATMALAGASKNILIDIHFTGLQLIRLVYTRTSGTGTVTVYMTAKES